MMFHDVTSGKKKLLKRVPDLWGDSANEFVETTFIIRKPSQLRLLVLCISYSLPPNWTLVQNKGSILSAQQEGSQKSTEMTGNNTLFLG